MEWRFKKEDNIGGLIQAQEEETREELNDYREVTRNWNKIPIEWETFDRDKHKDAFRGVIYALEHMQKHNKKVRKLAIELENKLLSMRNGDDRIEALTEDEARILRFGKDLNIHLMQIIDSVDQLEKAKSEKSFHEAYARASRDIAGLYTLLSDLFDFERMVEKLTVEGK